MHYLISPLEETFWFISEFEFLTPIREKWPWLLVEKTQHPQNEYAWEWETPLETEKWIQGGLSRDGKVICLEGYLPLCAEFAIWIQQQFPEQPLWLYDEACNVLVALPGKTAEQVREVIHSSSPLDV